VVENPAEKPARTSGASARRDPISSISMRFEIVTIFPGFFASIFEHGILRRALAEGLIEVGLHDLREFTHDRHRTVDDRPFGGGEGMVLKPEPLAEALAALGIAPKPDFQQCQGTTSVVPQTQQNMEGALAADRSRQRVILLSAQGRPFTQAVARELAELDRIVLAVRAPDPLAEPAAAAIGPGRRLVTMRYSQV